MTVDQTSAVVREHVEAFNDGDLARLMAVFAEDTVWITGATVVRGRAELKRFFGAAMEGLRPRLTVENLVVADGRAACQMTETLLFQGEERTFSIAAFFRLRDGVIVAAKVYREGSAELS